MVWGTVTVTVAPGCPFVGPPPTGDGLVELQSPSPSTSNHTLPSTLAVMFPRTHAPSTAWVTLPSTVMSLPSSVSPPQSTVATVFSLAEGDGFAPWPESP
ncbi:hypothetical protein SVIOM74S_01473 [Streptomyces violarus]